MNLKTLQHAHTLTDRIKCDNSISSIVLIVVLIAVVIVILYTYILRATMQVSAEIKMMKKETTNPMMIPNCISVSSRLALAADTVTGADGSTIGARREIRVTYNNL